WVPRPASGQEVPEFGHVGQQFVLAHLVGWSGWDVDHGDPVPHLHGRGQLGGIPSGMQDDFVPEPGADGGEFGRVGVLPAARGPPQRGERAGVFGDHVDPHRTTSSRRSFHAERNRSSEYLSLAALRASMPAWRARSGSAMNALIASTSTVSRVETTPAPGGMVSAASVAATATTGMPRCIASSRANPSEVHRYGCR